MPRLQPIRLQMFSNVAPGRVSRELLFGDRPAARAGSINAQSSLSSFSTLRMDHPASTTDLPLSLVLARAERNNRCSILD